MNEEEYDVGYNDYVNSNEDGRKLLIEQAELRSGDFYWQGVKAAYHNISMENWNV